MPPYDKYIPEHELYGVLGDKESYKLLVPHHDKEFLGRYPSYHPPETSTAGGHSHKASAQDDHVHSESSKAKRARQRPSIVSTEENSLPYHVRPMSQLTNRTQRSQKHTFDSCSFRLSRLESPICTAQRGIVGMTKIWSRRKGGKLPISYPGVHLHLQDLPQLPLPTIRSHTSFLRQHLLRCLNPLSHSPGRRNRENRFSRILIRLRHHHLHRLVHPS